MGYDAAPVSNYQEISRAGDADSTALTDADLRALTGYTAMEIGSNEEQSEDAWNVARRRPARLGCCERRHAPRHVA
jgi:hypothetical protein